MALDDDAPAARPTPLFHPPQVAPAMRKLSLPELALAARRNILETIPAGAYQQPIISGQTVGRWHMVTDPDALKRVLLDRVDAYPKSRITLRILRAEDGASIFTSEGESWRWQRRAAAPLFAHRKLVDLSPAITAAAHKAADALCAAADAAPTGIGAACVQKVMVGATLDVVCDALLSGGRVGDALGLDRARIAGAIGRYFEAIGRVSFLDILEAPDWIPRPLERRHQRLLDDTVRMVDRLVAARRADFEAEGARADLIRALIAAVDPDTGRRMDDATIRNNLLAFIIAGHETTALTLAWALYLLANDPAAQARAAAEARAALDGEAAARPEHLAKTPYLRQVIEEALRLFPPAALMSRQAREADQLCGRRIAPGDTVLIPIYALHRRRGLWERPTAFDPEHFAPERAAARPRFTYLPFGAGPRICIGAGLAMMEAQIILATVLARVRVGARTGHRPEPVVSITLRPKGGMPLRVARR